MIATFYCLSVSGAIIGRYPNTIFIMSVLIFLFSKNIVSMLSILAFMANTSNLIMKLAMCFLLCLNVSIFHLESTVLLLLLNIVLISLIESSQF